LCVGCIKGVGYCINFNVSGCFESIASISRSLYSIVRNVGGYEEGEERLAPGPGNICSGIFMHGFGGCIAEVGEGIISCMSNPCDIGQPNATCFPRTAKGVFNLFASPFSGSLRWIHSTSIGGSRCFKKQEHKNGWRRFPR